MVKKSSRRSHPISEAASEKWDEKQEAISPPPINKKHKRSVRARDQPRNQKSPVRTTALSKTPQKKNRKKKPTKPKADIDHRKRLIAGIGLGVVGLLLLVFIASFYLAGENEQAMPLAQNKPAQLLAGNSALARIMH